MPDQAPHKVHVHELDGSLDIQRTKSFVYDFVDSWLRDIARTDNLDASWPNLNSMMADFATYVRALHNVHEDEQGVIHYVRYENRRKIPTKRTS